jgi:hypothetical protein
LNSKIINLSFFWVIEIYVDIEISIQIEAKLEKRENQPLSGIDVYSRSATAPLSKVMTETRFVSPLFSYLLVF